MNLDDLPELRKLDPQNILAEINKLPNQLAQA